MGKISCTTTHHHACDCREAEFACLQSRIAELEKHLREQTLINGLGTEHQARLTAKVSEIERERDAMSAVVEAARQTVAAADKLKDTSGGVHRIRMALSQLDEVRKG
jgi:ABC-type phosphate transport system auxiliary subunit